VRRSTALSVVATPTPLSCRLRSTERSTAAVAASSCVAVTKRSERARLARLPARAEVLRLLVTGQDNAQVARALVIAASTVKSHVNHIFGKLGVRTRVEAVLRAQELNLL